MIPGGTIENLSDKGIDDNNETIEEFGESDLLVENSEINQESNINKLTSSITPTPNNNNSITPNEITPTPILFQLIKLVMIIILKIIIILSPTKLKLILINKLMKKKNFILKFKNIKNYLNQVNLMS